MTDGQEVPTIIVAHLWNAGGLWSYSLDASSVSYTRTAVEALRQIYYTAKLDGAESLLIKFEPIGKETTE